MTTPTWVSLLQNDFDAIIFDVGNTLVEQAPPTTPINELVATPLRGVHETLSALQGNFRLGIVSNTTVLSGEQLQSLLAEMSDYFSVIIATADLGVHKPDPTPLLHAAQLLEVAPERCLYVGDIETDAHAAQAAGMAYCPTGPDLLHALGRFAAHRTTLARAFLPSEPRDQFASDIAAEIDSLAKPPGAMGELEVALQKIAAITHSPLPQIDPVALAIFVADHEIAKDETVTPWPWEISRTIAELSQKGKIAANAFAQTADVYVEVVDVGLATGPTPQGVRNDRVRNGSGHPFPGPSLSIEEVHAAVHVGAQTAERLIAGGTRLLCVGEVGIGNTTPAAAIVAWALGVSAHEVTGRGSGIDDVTLQRKTDVVAQLVEKSRAETDPLMVLTHTGGLEIAALTGAILAATSMRIPVLLDGMITVSAALLADRCVPTVRSNVLASHVSPEPASSLALAELQLTPLLSLGLRIGEGTGALLAVPLLRSARNALVQMARLHEL